jgi:hypothetical protein
MSHTLAASAAACGMNKSTILRAIKSGKVSATKDEHGEWHIEPIECHRVYPPERVLRERNERVEQWHRGRGSRPEPDAARRSAFRAIGLGTIDGEAANLPSCRPMKKTTFCDVHHIASASDRRGLLCLASS